MTWPAPEPKEENDNEEGEAAAEKSDAEEKPAEKKEGPEMQCAAFVKIQNYREPPAPDATIDTDNQEKPAD